MEQNRYGGHPFQVPDVSFSGLNHLYCRQIKKHNTEDSYMAYNPYEEAANANLQRYLRQLSYFDPSIPRPPLDGIFEAATEEALRAYQRSVGLPETGIADAKTWERLYSDYLISLDENSPPAPIYIFCGSSPFAI